MKYMGKKNQRSRIVAASAGEQIEHFGEIGLRIWGLVGRIVKGSSNERGGYKTTKRTGVNRC